MHRTPLRGSSTSVAVAMGYNGLLGNMGIFDGTEARGPAIEP